MDEGGWGEKERGRERKGEKRIEIGKKGRDNSKERRERALLEQWLRLPESQGC
jgi:hypothetical protein